MRGKIDEKQGSLNPYISTHLKNENELHPRDRTKQNDLPKHVISCSKELANFLVCVKRTSKNTIDSHAIIFEISPI